MNSDVHLSAIVLTKNSEEYLQRCLTALKFCDETVVIDDESTDSTRALAEACGARVMIRKMQGDFAEQRRFGIEQARGQWVLFIDSDEIVTEELAKEIQTAVSSETIRAYELARRNCFEHYSIQHGSMRSDRVLRLFPKDGLRVEGRVHEKIISPYPVETLKAYLDHYPYEDWSVMIRKLDIYTSYLALQQIEKGKKTGFISGALVKPTWAFLKVYVFNGGLLDGKMGLLFAIHHAYYTFMKYAKYYLNANSDGKF